MAHADTFHCQVITPEAAVLDVQASAAVITAHDGKTGILHNRAPLLCKLGIGELRVTTAEATHHYYVEGGFAHLVNNELTLLTAQAIACAEIDRAAAEADLAELQTGSQGMSEVRSLNIKRAKTKIRLAKQA